MNIQPLHHELQKLLEAAAIPSGCVLQIHSKFSGLGRTGLSPDSVIMGLLNILGEDASLLMPAMSWSTVTPSQPIFDVQRTASHTGILTEVFRTGYATARSLHPTHSVCGTGPQAEYLLSTHHLGTTPVPLCSPYGKMRETQAHILLIGVGLESCTAFHHPEEMLAPEVYLRPASEAEDYVLRGANCEEHAFTLRRHTRLMRNFEKFRPELAAKGILRSGEWRGVVWTSLVFQPLMQLLFRRLAEDSRATLQVEA
jgi:aminoglycoside 3-N-acetyltransferase